MFMTAVILESVDIMEFQITDANSSLDVTVEKYNI
jgi:hypothetical protein